VSGASRSERPCDFHTIYERIGMGQFAPLWSVSEPWGQCNDLEP